MHMDTNSWSFGEWLLVVVLGLTAIANILPFVVVGWMAIRQRRREREIVGRRPPPPHMFG